LLLLLVFVAAVAAVCSKDSIQRKACCIIAGGVL
jgi:hypothetical protein